MARMRIQRRFYHTKGVPKEKLQKLISLLRRVGGIKRIMYPFIYYDPDRQVQIVEKDTFAADHDLYTIDWRGVDHIFREYLG